MDVRDTILDRLRHYADADADRLAYTFLGDGETASETLTYGQLDRRARNIASAIQEIDPADPVLLLYPPGLEFVAALLGCFYASAIAVPLPLPHPRRDQDRLRSVKQQCGAGLALAPGSSIAQWRDSGLDLGVTWLASDEASADTGGRDTGARIGGGLRGETTPANPAYLQYTSGSTASPKGVMVSHANVLHNIAGIDAVFRHTAESVAITWLPHFHDMGLIYGVLAPLYGGFPVVMMPPAAFVQKPVRWLNAISTYGGTHSGGPDFAFDLCVRKVTPEDRRSLNLGRWTVAFNGAERVRPDTLESFARAFAPCGFDSTAFRPAYGLAEATLMVSCLDAGRERSHVRAPGAPAAVVGCGAPDQHLDVAIVDPVTMVPRPDGHTGEIWVSGPSVAGGYWRNPTATQETFGATLDGGGKSYLRTGDLGFLASGQLHIAGRLKDLVIIRGENHCAEDLEATIERAHPAIRRSACAAFATEEAGEERLTVVVETTRGAARDPAEICAAVRHAIAEAHQISVRTFVVADYGAIPKTPSGKVRRRECRARLLERRLPVAATIEAPGAGERAIETPSDGPTDGPGAVLETIAAVLRMPAARLDVTRSLTSQGLDSLTATELSALLESRWNIRLTVAELLAAERVAEIIEAPRASQPSAESSPSIAIRPREISADSLPLSPDQQRLWTAERLSTEPGLYHIMAGLRCRGPVSRSRWAQCLQALARRHAALRMQIAATAGSSRQTVVSPDEVRWDVSEVLSSEATFVEDCLRERARPIDPRQAPLVRATLLRLSTDESVLLIVAHHLVADGRSLAILIEECAELYGGAAPLDTPPDPRLTPAIGFDDVIAWREASTRDASTHDASARVDREDASAGYWRTQLSSAPLRPLWPASAAGAAGAGRPRTVAHAFDVPAALVEQLRREAAARDVTVFTWMLATFATTLHTLTGENDLIVGCPVGGRARPELARVVGSLAQPLPMRIQIDENDTFDAVLRKTRATVLAAYAHQSLPYERIIEAARAGRMDRRGPLIRLMLNLLPATDVPGNGSGPVAMNAADVPAGPADMDLALTLIETPDGLRGWIMCHGDHGARVAEQMAAGFVAQLTTFLRDQQTIVRPSLPAMVVAATFRAEPIERCLRFWTEAFNQRYAIDFAPYNQIWQQLLDPDSPLRRNQRGLNVVAIRVEDWDKRHERSAGDVRARALHHLDELAHALRAAADAGMAPTIVSLCPHSPDFLDALGGAAAAEDLERDFANRVSTIPGVSVLLASETLACYPVARHYAAYGDRAGDLPFTPQFYTALGTMIARRWHGLSHPPKKLVVLDCDNTLWTGICGEDGVDGIVLDPSRLALQEFMAQRAAEGMLLGLCSRNHEEDVRTVFRQRADMRLKWDDLVGWKINWRPKNENIRELASELGIALRDIIFVDDDPVECALMQEACPELLTIHLPGDATPDVGAFLRRQWAFDTVGATAEDRLRTRSYQENARRDVVRRNSASLDDFIASLELEVRTAAASPAQLERVVELMRRTNQFNTSKIVWTLGELKARLRAGYQCLVCDARDRFGDYGLVGVAIARDRGDAIDVESLLLSCRALGRRIEARLLDSIRAHARQTGRRFVDVWFVPTARNMPALTFLEDARPLEERRLEVGSVFRFDVDVDAAGRPHGEITNHGAAL